MTTTTVVIAIGPDHADISRRALASVEAQTIACDLLAVYDPERRGPGWARNQGLAQAKTPYIVFLDADDYLEPTFAERTLAVRKPLRYVYCDWLEDERIVPAPDKPWCGSKSWHCMTTLIPTEWVRRVGGFDEKLPGAEDLDFYLRLTTNRNCGQRLAEPLFHYSGHGLRSHEFEAMPDKQDYLNIILERYRGKMGCCGGESVDLPPQGDKLPGDVLAIAIWGGNQRVTGRQTGRIYPRTGNGKLAWVDPHDVQVMPDKWRLAPPEPAVDAYIEPDVLETTDDVARVMMSAAVKPITQTIDLTPVEPVVTSPDVAKVLRLGRR